MTRKKSSEPSVGDEVVAFGGTGLIVEAPRRGRGRPKGSKNKVKHHGLTESEQVALEESRRVVQAGSNLTANQVVNRSQIKSAVSGGAMAQRSHLDRVARLEQKSRDAEDKLLESWESYVMLGESLLDRASTEQRERLDRMLLPHPHDVDIDFARRKIAINGPATTLERRNWNTTKADLNLARDMLLNWRRELEQKPDDKELQYVYTYGVCRYMDVYEVMPERHRPEPLPKWPFGGTISYS